MTHASKDIRERVFKLFAEPGQATRFLDETEFWLEANQNLQRMENLSVSDQKLGLEAVANTCKESARILGNLDWDTHAILCLVLQELHDPLSEEIPELKNMLDRLGDVAREQAKNLQRADGVKGSTGASKKTDRDIFVKRIVKAFFNASGCLKPRHGQGENFIDVVEGLCTIAGYGKADIRKLIGKTKKSIEVSIAESSIEAPVMSFAAENAARLAEHRAIPKDGKSVHSQKKTKR